MNPFKVLGRRVRGFRVIDLAFVGVLAVLVLVVYLAKAGAGVTRADIDRAQQQIVEEQGQIRLLRAEVASEEQPERLTALSAQFLHLQPIPANHEIQPDALAAVARDPSAASAPNAGQPSPAPAPVRGGR